MIHDFQVPALLTYTQYRTIERLNIALQPGQDPCRVEVTQSKRFQEVGKGTYPIAP